MSAVNGWGPFEPDRSNGEQGAADGGPLTLNGTVFAKGLGVHAASDLRYTVPAGCTTFTASVGLDDEVGSNGSVIFQVYLDGTAPEYDSGAMTGATATKASMSAWPARTSCSLSSTTAGMAVVGITPTGRMLTSIAEAVLRPRRRRRI